jgi:hypothetical protein
LKCCEIVVKDREGEKKEVRKEYSAEALSTKARLKFRKGNSK